MKDQSHLWAREYDRDLGNLLGLQGEIAQEIAGQIQIALGGDKSIISPTQPSLSPQTYEAYDLYLKGRYAWNKRTVEGLRSAITYFEQATAKDPNYARAYAGLADSYALLGGFSVAPPTLYMPKARTAALRALQLDDKLAEAHTSLALIAEYDWDWPNAEMEYRRAIELNPNYPTAHHWYAEYLMTQGRFDEALTESERARQLDPLSLIINADNGAILYFARQHDRAIAKLRSVLDVDEEFPAGHMIIFPMVERGQLTQALAELSKWRRPEDKPWNLMLLTYVYTHAGQPLAARRTLAELESLHRHQEMDIGPLLFARIAIGDKDQAFALFENAYQQHSTAIRNMKAEPFYDPVRGDPRFRDLMHRAGLAQ